jgi:hypothetical protein
MLGWVGVWLYPDDTEAIPNPKQQHGPEPVAGLKTQRMVALRDTPAFHFVGQQLGYTLTAVLS